MMFKFKTFRFVNLLRVSRKFSTMSEALLAGSPHFDCLFTEPFKQLVCSPIYKEFNL